MKELGEISYALGIKVERNHNEIQLHQELYVNDILARSDVMSLHTALSPMQTGERLAKRIEGEETCDPDFNYRAHVGCYHVEFLLQCQTIFFRLMTVVSGFNAVSLTSVQRFESLCP